jgi:hypothetical protein
MLCRGANCFNCAGVGCSYCTWFTFSPNPVADELTISFNEPSNSASNSISIVNVSTTYSIKLIDNMGNLQRQATYTHNPNTKSLSVKFNTSNLPEGTYFLHIENMGKIEKHQIVVKR